MINEHDVPIQYIAEQQFNIFHGFDMRTESIRRSRGICPCELNLGRVVGSLVWPVEVGDILGAFLGVALRVSLWVDESSGLRSGA